jgi:hypothetical protein
MHKEATLSTVPEEENPSDLRAARSFKNGRNFHLNYFT